MSNRNNLGFWDWENIIVDKYFLRNRSNVLDIGCGTGREAMALAKLGYKVFGIDTTDFEALSNFMNLKQNEKEGSYFYFRKFNPKTKIVAQFYGDIKYEGRFA